MYSAIFLGGLFLARSQRSGKKLGTSTLRYSRWTLKPYCRSFILVLCSPKRPQAPLIVGLMDSLKRMPSGLVAASPSLPVGFFIQFVFYLSFRVLLTVRRIRIFSIRS